MSETATFTKQDVQELLKHLGLLQIAIADGYPENEGDEEDEEDSKAYIKTITDALRVVRSAQVKLGAAPCQNSTYPLTTISRATGVLLTSITPVLLYPVPMFDTFPIKVAVSQLAQALKDYVSTLKTAHENEYGSTITIRVEFDREAADKALSDMEEYSKKLAEHKIAGDTYKKLPFASVKGKECCDMIHIMKETGFSESQIRAGIFAFWTGVNMPHPLNR